MTPLSSANITSAARADSSETNSTDVAGHTVRPRSAGDRSALNAATGRSAGDSRSPLLGGSKRRFAPTASGVIGVTVVVAMAMLSLGLGPAACVVSSLALAAVLISAVVAARNLSGSDVRVHAPKCVDAGVDFPVRVEVISGAVTRDVVVALAPGGASVRPSVYLGQVDGKVTRESCSQRANQRGRVTGFAVELRSSFPFGLFETRFRTRAEVEMLVRPRVGKLRVLERHLRSLAKTERRRIAGDRGEEEFRALREWRPGESRRRIGWKASARRGRLVVRDFEDPRRVRIEVVLDRRAPRFAHGSFEIAVRLAASLIRHYHGRAHAVRLDSIGGADATRDATPGRGGDGKLLDALAEIRPVEPAESIAVRSGESPERVRDGGRRRIIVRCGGENVPASYRGADAVLDVDRAATRTWLNAECGWMDVR